MERNGKCKDLNYERARLPEFASVRARKVHCISIVQVLDVEHVRVVQLLDLSTQPDLLGSVPNSAHLRAGHGITVSTI